MKIEAGKYYRTRDGRKVGPMRAFCGKDFDIDDERNPHGDEVNDSWWRASGKRGAYYEDSNLDLIAEWTEDDDLNAICDERQGGPFVRASGSPKTWGKMTDEEQGALLLARHRGKDIQYWCEYNNDWLFVLPRFVWFPDVAYRVQPKPMRKTVTLYADFGGIKSMCDIKPIGTIDLEDGKPVADSIKMEEV